MPGLRLLRQLEKGNFARLGAWFSSRRQLAPCCGHIDPDERTRLGASCFWCCWAYQDGFVCSRWPPCCREAGWSEAWPYSAHCGVVFCDVVRFGWKSDNGKWLG